MAQWRNPPLLTSRRPTALQDGPGKTDWQEAEVKDMTQLEKLKKLIPEEADDAILEYYLDEARSEYLNLRYPYGGYATMFVQNADGTVSKEPVVEPVYLNWQLAAAVELYAKRGGEGEVSHTENGVSRSWDNARLSSGLRNRIVPYVGVVG